MRLKIIGGELDVEFGSILDEARKQLEEAAKKEAEAISKAGDASEPTKDGMGKLGRKPKIPI